MAMLNVVCLTLALLLRELVFSVNNAKNVGNVKMPTATPMAHVARMSKTILVVATLHIHVRRVILVMI